MPGGGWRLGRTAEGREGSWRRFPRLPFLLVLFSLVLLILVPLLLLMRIEALGSELDEGLRPAREALGELQFELGIGTAASRAYVLSGDPRFLEQQREASGRRDEVMERLMRIAPTLAPDIAASIAQLEEGMAENDRLLEAYVAGAIPGGEYRELLLDQHRRLLAIFARVDEVESRLLAEIADRRARIERAYRLGTLAEIPLLFLALVAAFQVYRLGRQYQSLALNFEESEERFRQVGDHVEQVIWLASPDLEKRYYTNPAYERVWGRTVESAYADPQSPYRAIHPEDSEATMERIRGVRGGKSYDTRYRVIRPDGSVRWVRSRGYPVRNVRGEVYRIAGIAEDITEAMRAEEEREDLLRREREARSEADRRRAEIERIIASRGRLIRGLGHDLKNPLSAADGYLQLLERKTQDLLPPERRVPIERARRALHRALDLLENLLEFARAEAGDLVVESTRIDLGEIVAQVAEEYRGQAEAKGLRLGIRLPEAVPVIDSDGRRLAQILGNLLSNAVKYTEAGSIDVEVRVEEARVGVRVHDTGRGIAPEDQARIFQELQRVESTGEEGAGIGLAISRLLARALDGSLTVESEIGKGSTFSLWLPRRDADRS